MSRVSPCRADWSPPTGDSSQGHVGDPFRHRVGPLVSGRTQQQDRIQTPVQEDEV